MANGNLLKWSLFQNDPEILRYYTEVHVFNWGESAFLIKNDKVYAYGNNNPCFNGLGLCRGLISTPQEIRFLEHNGVKEIATGLEHAVLLDYNGIVYCWGNNNHGQLGTGNTLSTLSYKDHNLPPIRQISCGQFSTLALSYENEVWFWGRQFNVSVKGKIRAIPTLITLPDYVYIKSITSGCGDSAILDSNGTVYAWGFNGCGQLCQGHRAIVYEPKPVQLIDNCKHIIIARNRTAFITENGQFYIVGSDISNDDEFELRQFHFPGNFVSIAASWCKDLFAIENDKGEILKWEYDAPATVTTKTECKNIIDVFKDLWTPSIRSESDSPCNQPGIMRHMPLHVLNPNIDTFEEERPAEDAIQIKTTNISKIDSSDSETGGYMNVSEHFNEEVCSDITIKLSDESIHAHKLVLYVKSKHFKSLIEKSSKDMTMVDMSNWSSRSYKAYIKYLYTGKLELEAIEDIPEIFSLAEQDTNEKLKLKCVELWRTNLKPNNVVHLFHYAFNYQQQMFLQECGPLLQKHLSKIVISDEYNKLPEPVKLSLALTAALLRSS